MFYLGIFIFCIINYVYINNKLGDWVLVISYNYFGLYN